MNGFVAQSPRASFTLSNDGFWPDIDADKLAQAQRLDGNLTAARLETAIVAAMIATNRELQPLKAKHTQAGYSALAEVPTDQIADRSALVAQYERAIYAATSAEVAERYRSYSATNSSNSSANAEELTADDYRRDARFAIRDLLGVSRTTVELL